MSLFFDAKRAYYSANLISIEIYRILNNDD